MSPSKWLAVLAAILWPATTPAATFEPARTADGTPLPGVKLEGPIAAGDVAKLLQFYKIRGPAASATIYLRSQGGDVEEAIKLGIIVRRLGLKTNAATWDTNQLPTSPVALNNKDDMICASACFLVYAAGIERSGNYLALHRPYIVRDFTKPVSEEEFEARDKAEAAKVRNYLQDMQIGRYWIDLMMSTSPRGAYVPTWQEAKARTHPLIGPPSSARQISNASATMSSLEKLAALTRPLSPKEIAEQIAAGAGRSE